MSGGTDKSLAAQLGKIQSGMGSVFVSRVSSDAQRTDEHVKVWKVKEPACLEVRGVGSLDAVRQIHSKHSSFFSSSSAPSSFLAPRCKISPLYFSPCAVDHYLFWLILKSPQERSCPDSARWYKSNKWLHANKGERRGEELKTIFSSCHIHTMWFIRRINLLCLAAGSSSSRSSTSFPKRALYLVRTATSAWHRSNKLKLLWNPAATI